MDRALYYLNGGNTGMRVSSRGGGLKLESVPVESEGIYAFNIAGGGYIIASADSRTLPVLGYSNTGSISWEQMPPNMRSWLKSYEDAVAQAVNAGLNVRNLGAVARSDIVINVLRLPHGRTVHTHDILCRACPRKSQERRCQNQNLFHNA